MLATRSTPGPGSLCTGAIRMFPVGEVRYAARDSAAGSIGLLDASPFMRRAGIRVVGPERDDLETVIAAMHVEAALRTTRGAGVIEHWLGTVPAAVALGRALHASGDLWRLCRTERTVGEVVDFLAERAGPS